MFLKYIRIAVLRFFSQEMGDNHYNNSFLGSVETDMNQPGSLRNHENRTIYEEPLPQDLSETRRARRFFW